MVYKKPYRPNYRRRRARSYARKPTKPWRYKVADTAYRAFKMAKSLKDAVNVEYKRHNTQLSQADVDYDGSIYYLNQISQGDTDLTRDGDSVKIQNLNLRYNIASSSQTFARVIVFWDKQDQIVNPGDFLETVGSGYAPNSAKNYDNRFRTKTLYDRKHNLSVGGGLQNIVDTVIPINLHTQFYAGTTGIRTGALKILMISERTPATNICAFSGLSYVTFTDN